MKCPTCRKNELELTSRWDRFKVWAFHKLFPIEVVDLSQEKFTQGFGDGYKEGFARANQLAQKQVEFLDAINEFEIKRDKKT